MFRMRIQEVKTIENELLEEFPKASSLIEITRMRKKFDALQDPETFLPIT